MEATMILKVTMHSVKIDAEGEGTLTFKAAASNIADVMALGCLGGEVLEMTIKPVAVKAEFDSKDKFERAK